MIQIDNPMEGGHEFQDAIYKIMDRMRDNYHRGKGVRLSYEELDLLNLTFMGELWDEASESEDTSE